MLAGEAVLHETDHPHSRPTVQPLLAKAGGAVVFIDTVQSQQTTPGQDFAALSRETGIRMGQARSWTTATSLQLVKKGQRTHSPQTFWGNSITLATRKPCFSKKPGL